MTEPKWELTLSVTDRNNIGLIQPRKNNTNSELMRVHVTNKNGEPYDLTALKVFFVTHFSGKDGLKVPIQKEAKILEAKEGIFEFIFDQDCMQKVGRQEAYFEIYDYDKFLDATQNFTYEIISSSRNGKTDFTPWIGTWAEAEKMLDEGTAKNLNDRIEKINNTKADAEEVDELINQQKQYTEDELEKKTDNEIFNVVSEDFQRRLNNVQSGFIGEFSSESALQTEYPNGAKGFAKVNIVENNKIVSYTYTYKNNRWAKGGPFNSPELENDSVDLVKLKENQLSNETIIRAASSKNLFNKNIATHGFYLANWDGQKIINVDMAFVKVPVLQGKKFKLQGTNQQIAYYNVLGEHDGGMESVSKYDVIEPPKTTTTLGINCKISELNKVQLEYGTILTPYSDFGGDIQKDLNVHFSVKAKRTLVVDKDGYGDFSTIRKAVELVTDASEYRPYKIIIKRGEYKLQEEYSVDEINKDNFLGFMKNNHISWEGQGRTVVSGNLDTTKHTDSTIKRVSTANFVGNGDVKDIEFIGENVRYAVHDDVTTNDLITMNKNAIRHFENLKMTKIKGEGKGYAAALGGGFWSGMQTFWKNSEFYSEWEDVAFSYHNNTNFNDPALLHIEGCDFKSKSQHWSVRFGEVGSGTPDKIVLLNNNIQSGIWIFPETGTADKINFDISGSGNSDVPIRVDTPNDSTQQVVYNINNNTEFVKNSASKFIKKGDAVFKTNPGSVSKMENNTPNILFSGIAFQDIQPNDFGFIKTGGFIERKDLSISVLKTGDLIGIKNGQIAVVEPSEMYFGYVFNDWFIKFV